MNAHEVAESIMIDAKKLGLDKYNKYSCWDVVVEFYKRYFNIELPNYQYNKRNLTPPDEVYKQWTVIDKEDLQPGDVVVFKSTCIDGGWHMTTYLGDDDLLNADYRVGVIVQKLSEADVEVQYYARYNKVAGE